MKHRYVCHRFQVAKLSFDVFVDLLFRYPEDENDVNVIESMVLIVPTFEGNRMCHNHQQQDVRLLRVYW